MQKESITFMSTVLKENLFGFIQKIKSNKQITVKKNRFIILKTQMLDYSDYFFVFYQIAVSPDGVVPKIPSTTMINKKGTCFFTVNALNLLVQRVNGKPDPSYIIDWTEQYYKNKIFFTNNKELIQIPTIIHDIKH